MGRNDIEVSSFLTEKSTFFLPITRDLELGRFIDFIALHVQEIILPGLGPVLLRDLATVHLIRIQYEPSTS